MPQIMENGTKAMQLKANMLMGQILLKMGAIKLEINNNAQQMQEESKIADEQDLDIKTYQ